MKLFIHVLYLGMNCSAKIHADWWLSLLDVGQREASHVDRRRSHDIFPACESGNPTDANDPDCYSQRWNLLVRYYPSHLGLKSFEQTLVSSEVQAEALSKRTLSALNGIRKELFGTVGAPLDGLGAAIRNKIDPMNQALKMWVSDAMNRSRRIIDSLKLTTQRDVQNVQNQTESALDDFRTKGFPSMFRAEFEFSKSLLNASLSQASQVLREAANSLVVQRQKRIEEKESALSKSLRSEHEQLLKTENQLQSKVDKSTGLIDSAIARITGIVSSVNASVRGEIAKALEDFDSASGKSIEEFSNKANGIVSAVADFTGSEVSSGMEFWKDLVQHGEQLIQAKIDSIETSQLEASSQAVQDLLSSAERNISDWLASFSVRKSLGGDLSSDLSSIMAKKGNFIADSTQTSFAETGFIHNKFVDLKNEMLNKAQILTQQGLEMRNHALNSLIRSIGEAAGLAKNAQENKMNQVYEKTVNLLDSLGQSTLAVSEVSSTLAKSIQTENQLQKGIIDTASSALDKGISDRQRSLTDSLENVSGKLQGSGMSLSGSGSSVSAMLEGAVKNGGENVRDSVNAVTRDVFAMQRDLSEQLRSDFRASKVPRIEQMRKLLNEIFSVLLADSTKNETVLYKSSQSSIESAVSLLASALADSDEAVTYSLNGVVNSLQLPSLTKMDVSLAVKNIISEVNDKLRESKIRPSVHGDLSSVYALSQKAVQSRNDVTSLITDSENIQDSVESDFNKKMNRLNSPELVANENSEAVQKITESQETLLSYISKYMGNSSNYISSLLEYLKTNALNSSLSAIQRGEQILSSDLIEVNSASNYENRKLIDGISRDVLSEQADRISDFTSTVSQLERNMSQAKKFVHTELSRVMSLANQTIQSIPIAVKEVLKQDSGEYKQTSARLLASLNRVREQLAQASTSEERNRLVQDVTLLIRMHNLSLETTAAHDALLANMSSQNQFELKSLSSTKESLRFVADMITQAPLTKIRANDFSISSIAQSASNLLNGFPVLINESVGSSAFEAAEAIRDSAFSVALQDGKNGVLGNQILQLVRNVGKTSKDRISNQTYDFKRIDASRKNLEISRKASIQALNALEDSILRKVLNASSMGVNGSSESMNDVRMQLSMMRYAMFDFLGLWSELARSVSSQISLNGLDLTETLHSVDMNYSNVLENSVHQLNVSDRRISQFTSELISIDGMRINSANQSWYSLLDQTVTAINELNTEHNFRALRLEDLFDFTGNLSTNVRSRTLSEIQALLSDYSSY